MELAEAGHEGRPVSIIVDASIARTAKRNVAACFARRLPRFHAMPGLGKCTGPVALIGGGPSLRGQIEVLKRFPGPIMGCGSVHDYLLENGIVPAFHVVGDPDEDGVTLRWLRQPKRGIKYLVASHCPQAVFNVLAGYEVLVWHLALPEGDNVPDFRGEPTVPGGHFIIARAWPIAGIMGFRDIHFFGFDCSFPAECEDQHAYTYNWTLEEPCGATCGDRHFVTTPGLLSQLQTFTEMAKASTNTFSLTIHGDGLAAAAIGG